MTTESTPVASDALPFLRVVSGDPTPEELAAVIAVIAARSGGAEESESPASSTWSDRSRSLRPTLTPGPGAWRASSFPR